MEAISLPIEIGDINLWSMLMNSNSRYSSLYFFHLNIFASQLSFQTWFLCPLFLMSRLCFIWPFVLSLPRHCVVSGCLSFFIQSCIISCIVFHIVTHSSHLSIHYHALHDVLLSSMFSYYSACGARVIIIQICIL